MKTYKEWAACHRHLDVYLKPGDEIDREMVGYFKKHAWTRTKKSDYIQFRKSMGHYRNVMRKNRNVHDTIKQKDGRWFYAGLCYPGEAIPAVHHIFVRETIRKPDFGMTFYKNIHLPAEYAKHRGHWFSVLSGKIDGIIRPGIMIHILDKNGRELASKKTITRSG